MRVFVRGSHNTKEMMIFHLKGRNHQLDVAEGGTGWGGIGGIPQGKKNKQKLAPKAWATRCNGNLAELYM